MIDMRKTPAAVHFCACGLQPGAPTENHLQGCSQRQDAVNHPPHYMLGGVEVIDAIEAWDLGFCLGNAVKYIARAGKKDPAKTLEDLKKARWYLDREVARLEKP